MNPLGFLLQAYKGKGIHKLYPWQAAALECGADGSNLVYCAPTSGGKTLVAEVLMIRQLRETCRLGPRRYGEVGSEGCVAVLHGS